MTERDVLICGCCFTQFSDLKIFIDHKQNCGSVMSAVSNNNEVCSFVSTAQQTSHFGSQQIVLPSQGHPSIVSLPVGMPHVILQTSSGLSQMYRIVLEPSAQINSNVQLSQPSQMPNLIQQPNISGVETQFGVSAGGKNSLPKEPQDTASLSKKQEINEKELPIATVPMPLNDSSVTRLALLSPVDTSWTTHRPEPPTSTFGSLDSNKIPEKASNLHTEEEVATFLATQLVSQTTIPNQSSKVRENNAISKYNIVLEDPAANQSNLNFLEPNQKIISVQAKGETEAGNNEKCFNKSNSQKGNFEGNMQCLEGKEIIEKGTKRIACIFDNCKFSTMHKKDMVRHVRKHTGEKPFQCPECGLRLSRQDKLKVHLRTHSKERPYACTEPGCSYRGNEKAHLKKHIRTHTNERPFRCQFCSYGARDGSHLTVHLRSHTGDSPFHCQVEGCAATFKTSSDLKRHEKLHTGEKPFQCTECDYASSLKANLKVHFRINHCKGERFPCKSCSFNAASRKHLKEHEITHSCLSQFASREYEGKISKRDDSAANIDFSSHSKSIPQLADASGNKIGLSKGRRSARPCCPKNYKCDECGSAFVREDSFRSHIRQHERKRKEEEGKAFSSQSKEGLEENSQKGKIKSVYTLNYILQGSNNNSNLTRINLDLARGRNPVMKEAKLEALLPANAVNITPTPNAQEALINGTASTNEVFSTYMITIDGIPSVYSTANNALPKGPQLAESQSLTQDDPVVHILSSPISHSIQATNVISSSPKIIPLDEQINVDQSIT